MRPARLAPVRLRLPPAVDISGGGRLLQDQLVPIHNNLPSLWWEGPVLPPLSGFRSCAGGLCLAPATSCPGGALQRVGCGSAGGLEGWNPVDNDPEGVRVSPGMTAGVQSRTAALITCVPSATTEGRSASTTGWTPTEQEAPTSSTRDSEVGG